MPQPRKHPSAAARQAAYRQRCICARKSELEAKGLPALPAIPTIPGAKRWNAAITAAHSLLETTLYEMSDYFDNRSEPWQESERGEEHQTRIDELQEVSDALSALIL
jgi:hypothetical protein